jgi:hypothetical protein
MLPLRDSCHRLLRHHVRSKIPKNMVLLSAIFLGIFIEGTPSGQTIQTYDPPVPSAFNFASLTEPACPATNGSPLAPVTNEIHIFCYPTVRPAAIKDPKSWFCTWFWVMSSHPSITRQLRLRGGKLGVDGDCDIQNF